jgi:hypothetical protein
MRSENLTVALELLLSSFGKNHRYNPFRWRWKLLAACFLWLIINLVCRFTLQNFDTLLITAGRSSSCRSHWTELFCGCERQLRVMPAWKRLNP